jgi:hypothetical protein
MITSGNQLLFFQKLRAVVPEHLSLVDEIAEVLHISEDSAYRRLRGDKVLALDEVHALCRHFKLSLDEALGQKSRNIVFTGDFISPSNFALGKFLEENLRMLNVIHQLKDAELIFFSKEITPYHSFLFPELAGFRFYFLLRTLLNFPDYRNVKFSVSTIHQDFLAAARKCAELYYRIPSVEILSEDNILTLLRQIEYCKDARLFETEGDLSALYSAMERMVEHMKQMASEGRKFLPGKDASLSTGEYKLYLNNFYLGDNTILARSGEDVACFLIHSGSNVIRTSDRTFAEYQEKFIRNIISKSALISGVGEKERQGLFQHMSDKIKAYRDNKVQTLGNF